LPDDHTDAGCTDSWQAQTDCDHHARLGAIRREYYRPGHDCDYRAVVMSYAHQIVVASCCHLEAVRHRQAIGELDGGSDADAEQSVKTMVREAVELLRYEFRLDC
jgi:hypothetical protein